MTAIRDHYLPGALELRGIENPLEWDGFVALPDCGEIGSKVFVDCPDQDIGPLLVIGCAQQKDIPYLKQWNIIADVFTWKKWNQCVLEGRPGGAWVTITVCEGGQDE